MRISKFGLLLGLALVPAAVHGQDKYQPSMPAAAVHDVERARTLRLAGRFKEASEILERVTQAQPTYYLASYNLALTYADRKDYKRALPAFEQTIALRGKLDLSESTIFNSAGWAYLLAGDYANAKKWLTRAQEDFDRLPPESQRKLTNNLGTLYLATGDLESAEKFLNIAATKYNSGLARQNLGIVTAAKTKQTVK